MTLPIKAEVGTMNDERGRTAAGFIVHRSDLIVPTSPFLFLDLQRQLRVDVAAVVAGAVWELGVAALGAGDVMDRLEGVVRAALALAGLAGLLNGKHVVLQGRRSGAKCRRSG